MTTDPSTRPIAAPSPGRELLKLLWRQPLWAVPFALFFGTMFGGTLRHYVFAYELSLVYTYCIGLGIAAWQLWLRPRLITDLCAGAPKVTWRIVLSIAAVALISSSVAALVIHFTLLPGFLGSLRQVLIIGMWTLLFTALFSGINFAVVYYRQSMERARQVEQMRAELAEAELRALRAQINPHFLFNTLNSIASLIATDPAAAEETTTRLAEVFRYALRASEREYSPFGDELSFLHAYLEIERTRHGDRLRIEESIEPGLEAIPVPSLLLQPVVENAVRHGISPRPEGGTLRLSASRRDGRLLVEVADDGPGMRDTETPSGNGFGLHSVRERLRSAGLGGSLEIESEPGRGTRVRISLPLTGGAPPPTISNRGVIA